MGPKSEAVMMCGCLAVCMVAIFLGHIDTAALCLVFEIVGLVNQHERVLSGGKP